MMIVAASLPIALSSQTELADDGTVTLNIVVLQIVEEVSSVTDHLLKSAAAVEVLFVVLQVRGEVVDAGGEECDLYLGGSRIAFVGCVLLNQSELFVFLHGFFTFLFIWRFTQHSVGE